MLASVVHYFALSYFNEFQGISNETVTIETLEETRKRLVTEINLNLTEAHTVLVILKTRRARLELVKPAGVGGIADNPVEVA